MDQFFIIAMLLTMGLVHTAPTKEPPCCYQKTVGEVSYTLKNMADTSGYGCKSNCVYHIDGQPSTNFCFKRGVLPVKCDLEGENVEVNQTLATSSCPIHNADWTGSSYHQVLNIRTYQECAAHCHSSHESSDTKCDNWSFSLQARCWAHTGVSKLVAKPGWIAGYWDCQPA